MSLARIEVGSAGSSTREPLPYLSRPHGGQQNVGGVRPAQGFSIFQGVEWEVLVRRLAPRQSLGR